MLALPFHKLPQTPPPPLISATDVGLIVLLFVLIFTVYHLVRQRVQRHKSKRVNRPPFADKKLPPRAESPESVIRVPLRCVEPSRLHCEAVGAHVMALRWPRSSAANDTVAVDAVALVADYELARDALAARDTPFGLVHDFSELSGLHTLMPIAGQILPDAISISRRGLVRRVAVVHAFKGPLVRSILVSLVRLSPVSPSRIFTAANAEDAHAWAAAWAHEPESETCKRL